MLWNKKEYCEKANYVEEIISEGNNPIEKIRLINDLQNESLNALEGVIGENIPTVSDKAEVALNLCLNCIGKTPNIANYLEEKYIANLDDDIKNKIDEALK
jgi:hypothetical protein